MSSYCFICLQTAARAAARTAPTHLADSWTRCYAARRGASTDDAGLHMQSVLIIYFIMMLVLVLLI